LCLLKPGPHVPDFVIEQRPAFPCWFIEHSLHVDQQVGSSTLPWRPCCLSSLLSRPPPALRALVILAFGSASGYHIDGGTDECSHRPRSSVRRMSPLNDFCRRNHVGRSFVYEQIRDGKLIAVKVGLRTYITYEAELAWRSALPKLTPGPVARLSKTRPSRSSVRVA
jgi:hypothetical protein